MKREYVMLLVLLVVASSAFVVLNQNLWNPSAKEVVSPTVVPSPSPTVPGTSPTPTPTEQPNKPPTELRVFVAASLINLVKEHAAKGFEKENNVKILFNSGGSDALYAQIASGSPADVFMAADFKWTNQLKTGKLLDNDQYWNFTTNKLIVILPVDNPKNITTLLDLVKPHTNVIVAGVTVPVGKYTDSTLNKIQKTWGNRSSPDYKGPQWEHYRDRIMYNIVSYEPAVNYVVTKVLMGVCDAGFAYVTDVKFQGPRLQYLEIPSSVNTIGTYGIAVIKDTTNRDLATKYVNFWLSDEGKKMLDDYGFGAK